MRTIICELDNTLIKTELGSERFIFGAKKLLTQVLSSEFDLKRLKLESSEQQTDAPLLPVNNQVIELLSHKKQSGHQLVLLSSQSKAQVAEMLGDHPFDVITQPASSTDLTQKFGEFDYVGSQHTSDETWKNANERYVVDSSGNVSQKLGTLGLGVTNTFPSSQGSMRSIIKSLRLHQWLKNMLVFVPIITSQQLADTTALTSSIIMFFCFSFVASFGYIVNDLLDLQSDRAHPTKQHRPFASGDLTVRHGIIIGAALLVLAALGCTVLPGTAALALFCYLLLTISYSIYLKTKLMIDVVALGALFTLRVIGGAEAIQTEISFYLMSFSIFLFASLGMVKRYAELLNLQKRKKLAAKGRGYHVDDMAPVRIIGISMGYMSVFILGQYINSPVVTNYYSNPKFIWLLFPLLMFWLGRLWILANRGEVNEDPLIFTVKDRTSQLIFATAAVILILAN